MTQIKPERTGRHWADQPAILEQAFCLLDMVENGHRYIIYHMPDRQSYALSGGTLFGSETVFFTHCHDALLMLNATLEQHRK